VAGINTVDFSVYNDPCNCTNPVGLLVNVTDATAAAIPEPATLLIFGTALGSLGFLRRRKKAA
jgi:hypothetical protein